MTTAKHTPEAAALADAVLKAAGSGLRHYSLGRTRGAIFAAAQKGLDDGRERLLAVAVAAADQMSQCEKLLDGDDDFTAALHELRAAIAGIGTQAAPQPDIHAQLAERCQIAHIWGIEDVKEVRPDLDDGQCWAVLQQVERHLDSEQGITWDAIRCEADELFPQTAPATGDAA